MNSRQISAFRRDVWKYWKKEGRHTLPWRKTKDPYRILVSEVMLQQTQVSRVIPKYEAFLKAFPTPYALARAPLGQVLRLWNGLGYNRRAKFLRDSAKIIVEEYGGNIRDAIASSKLPGVGPYTRSAVRVFAFNEPDTLIETNVRAAIIHHFFKGKHIGRFSGKVTDKQIAGVVEKVAEGQDPKKWHSALMDYGAHIKKLHKNPARRSASYVRQSKFEGSLRQVRGAILKTLSLDMPTIDLVGRYGGRFEKALAGLARDGLIKKEKGKPARPGWRIA